MLYTNVSSVRRCGGARLAHMNYVTARVDGRDSKNVYWIRAAVGRRAFWASCESYVWKKLLGTWCYGRYCTRIYGGNRGLDTDGAMNYSERARIAELVEYASVPSAPSGRPLVLFAPAFLYDMSTLRFNNYSSLLCSNPFPWSAVFVEALDKCFENVCELDLIFHSDKVRRAAPHFCE